MTDVQRQSSLIVKFQAVFLWLRNQSESSCLCLCNQRLGLLRKVLVEDAPLGLPPRVARLCHAPGVRVLPPHSVP
jgi:hypothetical protein